jgi:hypothetical protein
MAEVYGQKTYTASPFRLICPYNDRTISVALGEVPRKNPTRLLATAAWGQDSLGRVEPEWWSQQPPFYATRPQTEKGTDHVRCRGE